MKLVYFAQIREQLGTSEENMTLPTGVARLDELIAHLVSCDEKYALAFQNYSRLKVAINQTYSPWTAAIKDNDEIAIFPPVTGG